MNHCPQGGYLVDGDMPLPTEPFDHDVVGLSRLGCNRVRCRQCQAVVRHVTGRSLRNSNERLPVGDLYDLTDLASSPLLIPMHDARLYLCRCSRWVQLCAESALDDPEPDPQTPSVPWRCAGHPIVELPVRLDGVEVTRGNLAEVITRSLHGWTPPGAHPESRIGADWAARMYVRFAHTPFANVVVGAATACLGASDAQACAGAQHFFYLLPLAEGAQRALELLHGDRRRFAGVPSRVDGTENDDTLEDGMWRVAARLVAAPGVARDLARADALTPGKGSSAVYDALARGDAEWIGDQIGAVARANPGQVERLAYAIRTRLGRERAERVLAKLSALGLVRKS